MDAENSTTDIEQRLREAADRIEALEREKEELRKERDNFAVTVVNLANQRDAAEASLARLSEALRKAGVSFETIRLILIKHLDEPERSAFWEAVHARDATRAALSGSGSGWRECATEGCTHAATVSFERGGVGSEYCHACYMRIQALPAAPQQGGE